MAAKPTWIDQLKVFADLLGQRMGKRRGWKAQVARDLPLDKSTLVKLLLGKRPGVSRETIEDIANKHPEFADMIRVAALPAHAGQAPLTEPVDMILQMVATGRIDTERARALRAHLAALERAATNADVERFLDLYGAPTAKEPGTGPRRITDRPARPK